MTNIHNEMPAYLICADKSRRAYVQNTGGRDKIGLIFFAGHGSDMGGTKALALESYAKSHDLPFLRFDYFGHGASDGAMHEGVISLWLEDCLRFIDQKTTGRQIIIGSSMGGWLMLLAAVRRVERIAGLIGIAAAPDFTHRLIWEQLGITGQKRLKKEKFIDLPNPYAEGEYVTYPYELIKDGRRHLVLGRPIEIDVPIILHHGLADKEVPSYMAWEIAKYVTSQNVKIIADKTADHRYSKAENIEAVLRSVTDMYQTLSKMPS